MNINPEARAAYLARPFPEPNPDNPCTTVFEDTAQARAEWPRVLALHVAVAELRDYRSTSGTFHDYLLRIRAAVEASGFEPGSVLAVQRRHMRHGGEREFPREHVPVAFYTAGEEGLTAVRETPDARRTRVAARVAALWPKTLDPSRLLNAQLDLVRGGYGFAPEDRLEAIDALTERHLSAAWVSRDPE